MLAAPSKTLVAWLQALLAAWAGVWAVVWVVHAQQQLAPA
jgi:hypothetical protein